jgi:hypothetical protein
MALEQQAVNWVGRLIDRSQRILDLRDEMKREVALYNTQGFGASLTDQELAAVESLAGYTQSDIWNAVTAHQEMLDALGDDVSGQAVNLIKMRR